MQLESPMFILSQDYELFFHSSGSVEHCLFEPCNALLSFADKHDSAITFFVDAGMLRCMERHATGNRYIGRVLDQVRRHIASLSAAGHEIALHVHPHWEDTRWSEDGWEFSNTRYRFGEFSQQRTSQIFRDYAGCLAELSGSMPTAYRAGGFCVEPFANIRDVLADLGVLIDSSVLPGAYLLDPDKGFDFRQSSTDSWWYFSRSPLDRDPTGQFLELAVTVQRMPFFFYWGRVLDRIGGGKLSTHFGDGSSKRIGKKEIVRRLLGASRIAELSIDDPKVGHLLRQENVESQRQLWQVMGHPKLLSPRSLRILEEFMARVGLRRFEAMTEVADRIRAVAREG